MTGYLVYMGTLLTMFMFAGAAHASSLLEIVGAPSGPQGFSSRTAGAGAAAAYFNPALLPRQSAGATIGFFSFSQSLNVDLGSRPLGTDIGESIYEARRKEEDGTTARLHYRPLPSDNLPEPRGGHDLSAHHLYVATGTVVHLVPGRVSVGFYGLVPTDVFQAQRPFFVDEREQYFSNSLHFERLGDRVETNVFVAALGVQALDSLSLGVGVTMASDAHSTNPIYLPDASDQESNFVNANVVVQTRFVPHIGVEIQPWKQLAFTATLHWPYFNEVKGQSELRFWSYPYPEGQDSIVQRFDYVYAFEPLRAGAGLRWRQQQDEDHFWEVTLGGLWGQWSSYRNRHGESALDAWSDTITTTLGASSQSDGRLVSLDLQHVPSPVPAQVGRTNYVDNARLAAALGWREEFDLLGVSFAAGLHLQGQRLLERQHTKSEAASHPVLDEFPDSVDLRSGEAIEESHGLQTNNPGFPGFNSQGWLIGAGLTVSVGF